MFLKTLHLRQFRNYHDQFVQFLAPKTILLGENAQGKSNLLESVELLATLRSHRASRDRDLVLEGCEEGRIAATLEKETGPVDLGVVFRRSGRRTLVGNGQTFKRQIDYLGILSAVEFSSLDLELVRGGPTYRRNWIDTLLVQLEPVYAHLLQQYNLVLRQRNALLKQQSKPEDIRKPDTTELAVWDAQLATLGTRVIRRRARAIARIAPLATVWHGNISDQREHLQVAYQPNVAAETDDPEQIRQAFLERIQERAIAEQVQGTSLVGPHRDEIEFSIDHTPARQFGSQGQQRTLVLALKLAELKLIESVIGEPPLLLLDDVLAELDLNRQNKLLDTIQDRFQTLITTTHLGSFDAQWLQSSQILTVNHGGVSIQF
ncbi:MULTISPECIES: DNA replication/repair protein RecF [unclassified Leptolyngbya]|uniref:DNA replication/repair protein RecF n=1 Tax=unclassified Leptolyngbya TaxID=2650499 RepID=UPI001686DA03|nr:MULTISPECIES: DNA replication/repair protein RecF [unclassified Leptolyngbya]MBD1912389.1 DNA replication/repair protein RecF [Leptolyngbya sp. FACHB-8]MBD2157975.1 DNA replication/repair protein RecF [Leptolyngbya sp. FACHB-16]